MSIRPKSVVVFHLSVLSFLAMLLYVIGNNTFGPAMSSSTSFEFPLIPISVASASTAISPANVQGSAALKIQSPWARATVAQQKTSGIYMQLTAVQDLRLLEVRTPFAKTAEIHSMAVEGDIMKMRPVSALDLPAGQQVKLAQGGLHVMLFDLKQQLKDGDVVPLSLIIEGKNKKLEAIHLQVPVQSLNSPAP